MLVWEMLPHEEAKDAPGLYNFQNLPTGIWMPLVWYASFGVKFALPSWALCKLHVSWLLQQPSGMGAEVLKFWLIHVFNSSGVWVCFVSFLSHVGSFWGAYYFPGEKRKTAPNPHTFSDSESCFKSSVLTVSSILDLVGTSGGSVSVCNLILISFLVDHLPWGVNNPCSILGVLNQNWKLWQSLKQTLAHDGLPQLPHVRNKRCKWWCHTFSPDERHGNFFQKYFCG